MNTKILGSVAVALLAGPLSANAQPTTYTYQGNAFTGALDIIPPADTMSYIVPLNIPVGTLSGFITLSAPLGDNLNNVSVTPAFIDLNTRSPPYYGSPLFNGVFAFSTNSSGTIDGWSMSLNGSFLGPGGYELTATSVDIGGVGGDSATMSTTCTAFLNYGSQTSFACGSSGSNTTPGVWTLTAKA